MTNILHIDSSARRSVAGRYSSHTRRLTRHFIGQWLAHEPDVQITYRDVAARPPSPVDEAWIEAAFTPPHARSDKMRDVLGESDELVDELERAELVVIGAPMYNFGVPSPLKAWIDNVVRVGRTFGFDRNRAGSPYWPLLAPAKELIILSSRGDGGYDAGAPLAASNLVEASLRVPLAYIGITQFTSIAAEWDEFSDHRVVESLERAEQAIDALVARLAAGSRSQAA